MDAVGDDLLDGLAVDDGGLQRVHIGRLRGKRRLGDLLGVGLELLVHAHEVSLAVQLDHGAGGARIVHDGHDGALVGGAPGLLGDGGEPAGAQHVDGLLHLALGLGQGLLALHHARAGHLAELFHHGSGDVSHEFLLWGKRWFLLGRVTRKPCRRPRRQRPRRPRPRPRRQRPRRPLRPRRRRQRPRRPSRRRSRQRRCRR